MHLRTLAARLRLVGWSPLRSAARRRQAVMLVLLLNCVALIATSAPPPPPMHYTHYKKSVDGLQTVLDDTKSEATFQITVTPSAASPKTLTDLGHASLEGVLITSGTAAAPAWVDVSVLEDGALGQPNTQRVFTQFTQAPKLEFAPECSNVPTSSSCQDRFQVHFARNPAALGSTIRIEWSLLVKASLAHGGNGVDTEEPLPWDVQLRELAP